MIEEIADTIKKKFDHNDSPVIITIGGPGGSGKSTLAQHLSAELDNSPVLVLDNYRKSRKERTETGLLGSNPEANDIDILINHLKLVKAGKEFNHPVYNVITGETNETAQYKPQKFNIIEGELALYDKVVEKADFIMAINCSRFSVFIDRLRRDLNSRDYSLIKSIRVFIKSNIIDYNKYYKPNSKKADIVIIRKKSNYKLLKTVD